MTIFLRALRLLAMTVWVGGLVFFAFILAPRAFSSLPTTHEAGIVVGGTLHVLNAVGFVCGGVFLVATAVLWFLKGVGGRGLLVSETVLVALMLAATAVVQFSIVPAMERDRIAAGGDVDAAPADNPARLDFDRLHPISEKVEGAALLLGLTTIVLVAAERDEHRDRAQL